ncbi:DUF3891 family protein [Halocatena salina]|uniref:DUF3891 family protein n=1 Tax=Halocatena salina TaxID=2934340 RepID=A0A8U0A4P4_9EURY|nr:DUF3891 family protein [Halocatena salina]UPM44175.1 DUF3891 family protein [Halocatena salina]
MIITKAGDGYQFVTQPDHATLSGRLAAHWGNDEFDQPAPHSAVCLAAEHHDHGWRSYDLRPHIDDDGTPRNFTNVPGEEWVEFYTYGIEAVAEVDAYAGLLTSMHATGLRRGGYGARPSIPDLSDGPPYESFVADQEQFQRDLLADLQDGRYSSYTDPDEQEFLSRLHETGDAEEANSTPEESRLWTNYLLLQTFDVLSLYFCGASELGRTEVGPVPTPTADGRLSLTVEPIGPSTVEVEPSPFDTAPLTLSVTTRTVPKMDADEKETEIVAAYYGAEQRQTEFTLY